MGPLVISFAVGHATPLNIASRDDVGPAHLEHNTGGQYPRDRPTDNNDSIG